jgi:hypothetical protein
MDIVAHGWQRNKESLTGALGCELLKYFHAMET